jgi:hypothetical protein
MNTTSKIHVVAAESRVTYRLLCLGHGPTRKAAIEDAYGPGETRLHTNHFVKEFPDVDAAAEEFGDSVFY